MSSLFIKEKHLNILKEIFRSYCPNAEIYAYGSRINGKAHSASDLDLTIKNLDKNKFISELKELISESNVPFLVDINEYDNLPQSFKDEINKNNIRIF